MQLSAGAVLLALGCAVGPVGCGRAGLGALSARASSEAAAYADTDHVAVVTPSVSGHVENPTAGWSVDGAYLVDVISAASVDIVSTASPRWTEVRQAGSARAAYKPGDLGAAAEGSLSSEPDYLAYAAGASITRDLDRRNVSLVLSYGYGHDTIGRAGTPFSVYSHAFDHHGVDAGVTLMLDRLTVLAVAADVILERGDQSKPYRYIPVFAPGVAPSVPAGATLQQVTAAQPVSRVIERLPLARDRFVISARLARRLTRATARVEGAAYADSWDMKAFTGDARLLLDLDRRWSLGAHLRYYVQSPVSFCRLAYVGSPESVPALRTGDRELGPLMNVTAGARVRCELGPPSRTDAWVLVSAIDATYTGFFADLYITRRLSALAAVSVEASW